MARIEIIYGGWVFTTETRRHGEGRVHRGDAETPEEEEKHVEATEVAEGTSSWVEIL
jgi:hypothetical protein